MFLALALGCMSSPRLSYDQFKPTIEGAQQRRDALVGNWYGEAVSKNGVRRRWLNKRLADGTYVLAAKMEIPGADNVKREYGVWGVSESVYYTIMLGWIMADGTVERADPRDANFYDAYKVLELSTDRFRYKGLETQNVFEVKRVSADFEL